MEKFEERQGVADLVFLKPADEMPAESRWEQRNLGPRFLDAAFAKQLLSRVKRRAHLFRLVRFGNGDQLDISRRATALFRGIRDLRSDAFQVFGDRFHI
jgi:hypothetical protein